MKERIVFITSNFTVTRSLARARGEIDDESFRRLLRAHVVIHRNVELERAILLRPAPAPIRGRRRTVATSVIQRPAAIIQPANQQMPPARIERRRNTVMVPRPSFMDFLDELQQNRTAHVENSNQEESSIFFSRGRPPLSRTNTVANSASSVLTAEPPLSSIMGM